MIKQNFIIPLEAYSKKIKLYFFGEAGGYSDIVVMNGITEEILLRIKDAAKHASKDSLYPFKTIEIDNLEPGRYSLFAINADATERSYKTDFVVTGDSKQDFLSTAISFSGVSNSNVDAIVTEISDKSNVPDWLFKKYIEEKDDEQKEEIAMVLDAYVTMLNAKIKNQNLTYPNLEINKFDGSFEMDPSAARLLRFDLTRNDVDQLEPQMLTNKQTISMRDDTLYLYVEVGEDDLPMSQQLVFVPNHNIRDNWARKEIERINKYQSAIETTVDYPAAYLEFTDLEREYITLIDRMQPSTAWVTAPDITCEYGYITASINSDDKPFFRMFGDSLYLAFSEPELCLDKGNQRTIPFSDSIRFVSDTLYLIDEDYFYWIEDSSGRIISDIRLFNFDMSEHEDFNDRIRRLFISKYQGHLDPYAMAKHSSVASCIKDAAQSCIEESDVSISNFHTRVLEYLCTTKKMNIFPEIAMCIEEDHTVYGDYYTKFFDSALRYKYKQDTIVLPPGNNIVYKIDTYKFGERKTNYIPCDPKTAIERRFYCEEFVIISAINTEDMRMSGFILLDFSASNIRANVYQFLIDTAEVIY